MSRLRISDEERRHRLADRHLLLPDRRTDDVAELVDSLLALHATDPASVHLSAWARMRHPQAGAVEALLADGTLVRHHAMRRTIWVACTPTMRLMHEAAGRKVAETERRNLIKLLDASGIADPEAWIERAAAEVIALLRSGGPMNSRAIGKALPQLRRELITSPGTKWASTQNAHTRLLFLLGYEGVITRTTPVGGWHTSEFAWQPTEDLLGGDLSGPPLAEAAGELADRWLQRFGPATAEDLQWWMGWTKTLTRQALQACQAQPVQLESGEGWLSINDPGLSEVEPWIALLPSLDPTTMGWKARGFYLSQDAAVGAFDSVGNAAPTVWLDGRVVGTWAQRDDLEIRVHWFEEVPRDRRRAVAERAEEIAGWVGGTRFRVRFPSKLHRELLT